MPFNGAGTFTRVYNWVSDKANGILINSTRFDSEDDGFATGLSNTICRDGQSTISADIPWSGRKIKSYGSTSAPNARTDVPQLGQVQDSAFTWLTTVAGTDTITANASPAISAYAAGQTFRFVTAGANTGTSVTLNVNGVGAKSVTKQGTTALAVGDLPPSAVAEAVYDGTQFQLLNVKKIAAADVSGAVTGPGSSTSGNIVTFNGTSGLSLQDSGVAPTVLMPTGAVIPYAGGTAPTGWLLCDGSAVSRTTYATLFGVVSTTYGAGDGSTTFNLPDLGGRVVAGKEATATRLTSGGSGINGAALGAAGGAETHALTQSELASHAHNVGSVVVGQGTGSNVSVLNGNPAVSPITTSSTGSGSAHQNTQPTIVLNYIIKT